MCKCSPEVRTPYCGREGCEWPVDPEAETRKAATEAARRSTIAGDVDDILEALPATLRLVLWKEARLSQPGKTRALKLLPQLIAHLTTAADEGWLPELVGRIERGAS